MKTLFRLLGCAVLTLGAASLSFAGPGLQYWQTLRNESQFKELKAGDKIAYVCNQCKTVTETTVESPAQAMEQCKEGGTVVCPKCKAISKVVYRRTRGDALTHTEIVYVDDNGNECMFLAKVDGK